MLKKILVLSTILLATSPTLAQQGMVLGGVISWDQDRIEQARGVDFALIAYDSRSGSEDDLIGFHDAINGFYPVVPRGTWLEAIVDPTGFGRVEGADYDPIGNLDLKSKDWLPCSPYRHGGYVTMIDTGSLLGPISFRFRIRHRDGKDKLNLAIFTVSWIRGGNLFNRFRVTVQKEPEELRTRRGEDRLPYLRGFIPATSRPDGQVSQQKVEVPATTVTQKLPKALDPPKDELAKADRLPLGDLQANVAHNSRIEYASVQIGAYQTSERAVLDLLKDRPSALERQLLHDARQNVFEQSVSEVRLSSRREQVAIVLGDNRPFTADIVIKGQSKALEIRQVNGRFEAVTWGRIESFISRSVLIIVTDDDGRIRTVNFTKEVK